MLFGLMQGRLLPKVKGRYQAFPGKQWQSEFKIAKKIGINLIEFIFEENDEIVNPLINRNSLDQILEISYDTGVKVRSVCADYFMNNPVYDLENKKNYEILQKLLQNCQYIGVKEIVIPFVDASKIDNNKKKENLIIFLKYFENILSENKIKLCLETDFNYQENRDLINKINSSHIRLNYDTGNSASLGFDTFEELKYNSDLICSYHIKDRKFQGGPVIFGSGDYKFDTFFSLINNKIIQPDYVILQSYRDDEGLEIFLKQFEWFKSKLNISIDEY